MKMVSHHGNNINWKRTNVQLASLACGVALAAVAIVGGSELLRDKTDTGIVTPVQVMQPTSVPEQSPSYLPETATDYSLPTTFAADVDNSVPSAAVTGLQNARGLGQPDEVTRSAEATLIDPTDFGSLGVESMLQPQYGTDADAAFDAQGLAWQQADAVVSGYIPDIHGIGQAAEATQSVEATLIDPTDFGSLGIESAPAESSYPPEAAVDYSLPTTFAADLFGAGHPDEGSEAASPMFGTMVDGVYVIEGDIKLP
jgi:hypothetical protein